jgi:hypothetical protein
MFSLKSILPLAFVTITAAIASAPQALADEGSFDMSTFSSPQAQAGGSFANGIAAAAGSLQGSPQTMAQNYVPNPSNRTGNQRLALAVATRTILSAGGSQSLPVTNLDSFVYQSGMSESIYGDEGVSSGLPPFMGMDESHTIGSGITDNLTTGHSSNLPSAWCTYE